MNLTAVTLALIVLTLLTVSLTRLGKVHTRADYLIAGRSLPAFVLVFTLLSSWIGSGSLLGGAENAYRHGFAALWQPAGGWAGLALIYFIAPARPPLRPVHHPRPARNPLQPDRPRPRSHRHPLHLHRHHQLPVHRRRRHPSPHLPRLHLRHPRPLSHRRLRHPLHRHRRNVFGRLHGRRHRPARHLHPLRRAPRPAAHRLRTAGWSAVRAALPATHFQIFGDLHPFNSYVAPTSSPTARMSASPPRWRYFSPPACSCSATSPCTRSSSPPAPKKTPAAPSPDGSSAPSS